MGGSSSVDPGASMLSSRRQVGKELHWNRMVSWPCKVYQGQLLQTRKGTVCGFVPLSLPYSDNQNPSVWMLTLPSLNWQKQPWSASRAEESSVLNVCI